MSLHFRDTRVPRRAKRRDARRRAPKGRRTRDLRKFIPSADSDFAFTGWNFLSWIKGRPEAFFLIESEFAELEKKVKAFRDALADAQRISTRDPRTISLKDEARKDAEEVVRRFANIIRADTRVSATDKKLLRIKERPAKLRQRNCPLRAPILRFKRSLDGQRGDVGRNGGGSGIHEVEFWTQDASGTLRRAKPDGAVRLELFVELVPVGEPLPRHPAERTGRPWFLRSFTKSPMRVEYPVVIGGAALVVYWGRWADATGDFSLFSKTCIARVEGWTSQAQAVALPEHEAAALPSSDQHMQRYTLERVQQKMLIVQAPYLLPQGCQGDDEMAREIAGFLGVEQRERLMLEAGDGR